MRCRAPALVFAVVGVVLFSCSKPTASTEPAASASAAPPASPPPPAPSAAPDTPALWSGTYSSAPGSLYVYDGGEWKGVRFRGDDAAAGLGEGTLSLTIDRKSGSARGVATGALGEVVLAGAVTADELTFSVTRKDPRDRGLTGTGVAKISGAAATGTMRLSRGDAHVIREANFSLSRTPP